MVLSVHPRYGFQHKDCGLAPPKDAPTNQTLRFTLELVQCFKKVGPPRGAGVNCHLSDWLVQHLAVLCIQIDQSCASRQVATCSETF